MQYLIVPAVIALAIGGYLVVRHLRLKKLRRYLDGIWGKEEALRRPDGEQIDDIRQYTQALLKSRRYESLTDRVTWNDLDMDLVFRSIDCSRSIVGSEVLHAMLHRQGRGGEELDRLHELSEIFIGNAEIRLEAQMALNAVGYQSFHGASRYLFGADYQYPRNHRVYYLLGLLPLLCVLAGLFYSPFFLAAALSFLVNILIYHITKSQWEKELTAIRHIGSVLHCAGKLSRLNWGDSLPPEAAELRELSSRLRAIRAWLPLFGMERVNDLDFITEYVKIIFMLDMVSLCRIVKAFGRQGQEVCRLYELVGTVDVCLSIAQMKLRERACTRPEFHRERRVEIRAVRHPLIADAVPNDCVWEANMLISGANASGKSTFIKAVAINLILAQTLGVCLAEALSMARGRVMSSMAIRDNITAGESYFISEIKSLKRIMDAAGRGERIYGFIDEILRGTNTVERIAASASVLEAFAGLPVLCMVATHDMELTVLMRGRFHNAHFSETVEEDGVHFDYLIKDGPATGRNAIRLLESMGFSGEITRQAHRLAEAYEKTGIWKIN